MAKQVVPHRDLVQIPVDRIFLYEENPRHEPIDSQPEIIAHLCNDEQVFNLARNIALAGPNPLEWLGVVLTSTSSTPEAKKNYQVWEGNRRVCAIKLLNDPDLAPAHLRKDFVRLSSNSGHVPIAQMNAVVFGDRADLKYWMGIIHGGAQAGVGRLDWDAPQKQRHFGSGRNRVALAVLDAAENLGLISKDDREGKLTTAQRFLNSEIVLDAIGIDVGNRDDIAYTRPRSDFEKQLAKFIGDLKKGIKVSSRKDKQEVDAYGRTLAQSAGLSGERIQPVSLKSITVSDTAAKKRASARKKAKRREHLEYDKELATQITALRHDKLESLYGSLCNIRLPQHTPLLTIGVWAFVETIASLAGKDGDTNFLAFFSKNRLAELGIGGGNKKTKPISDALGRIQDNGNATKHHEISATFDGRQLNNDLLTIAPLLIATLKSVASKK